MLCMVVRCLYLRVSLYGRPVAFVIHSLRIVSVDEKEEESGDPPGASVAILRGVVGYWCGGGSRP